MDEMIIVMGGVHHFAVGQESCQEGGTQEGHVEGQEFDQRGLRERSGLSVTHAHGRLCRDHRKRYRGEVYEVREESGVRAADEVETLERNLECVHPKTS